nr:hypothetical protein [uncultured Flavobacterium sp.]
MKTQKLLFISILFFSIPIFSQQIGDGFAPSSIQDFTLPLNSGLYGFPNPIGGIPDTSHAWQHLLVIRHGNPANNFQLQIGSAFATNDRLFFRKLAGGLEPNNPAWLELATRGANSFVGNQSITGNLGIGTSTPNSRLDLGSGYGVNGAKLLVYNDDPTGELSGTKCGFYMDNFTSNNLNLVFPEATAHPGLFTISAKNTAGTTLKPYFSIAGLTGNIGIGTTIPDSKLTVNGTIHATEVKVTQTVPADYVFQKYYSGKSELKPDYRLLTLSEIEKFTQANHHLPNVPSAKEIKENGVQLGEMSNILLQKIEELTLYSIEQQKTIEKLEKENEALKKFEERIIRLEKELDAKK